MVGDPVLEKHTLFNKSCYVRQIHVIRFAISQIHVLTGDMVSHPHCYYYTLKIHDTIITDVTASRSKHKCTHVSISFGTVSISHGWGGTR